MNLPAYARIRIGWAALMLVVLLASASNAAGKERVRNPLQIHISLETGEAPPPSRVCVLYYALAARDAVNSQYEGKTVACNDVIEPDICNAYSITAACSDRVRCAPRVDVPKPTDIEGEAKEASQLNMRVHVKCSDENHTPHHDGLLVIQATAGVSAKQDAIVDTVQLIGRHVTMNVTSNTERKELQRLVVKSVGGHFASRTISAEELGAHLVRLPIERRCEAVQIRLPPSVSTGDKVDVTASLGGRPVVCNATNVARGSSIRLELPRWPGAFSRTVNIYDSKRQASYRANWATTRPPRQLVAEPIKLQFEWQAPCMYSDTHCPEAELVALGRVCPPTTQKWSKPDRVCTYRCSPGRPIPLPSQVRFTRRKPRHQWRAQLSSLDQRFNDSYVPPELMTLAVDATDWETVDLRRAKRIIVIAPNGDEHVLALRAEKLKESFHVAMPGAYCDAPVRYRLVGPLDYGTQDAFIAGGAVKIARPAAVEQPWRVGLAPEATALFQPFTTYQLPRRFTGARYPLRGFGWDIYGGARLVLSYRVPGSNLSLDVRPGLALGSHMYWKETLAEQMNHENTPVLRYLVGGGIWHHGGTRSYGLLVDAIFTQALLESESDVLSPSCTSLFDVACSVALKAAMRWRVASAHLHVALGVVAPDWVNVYRKPPLALHSPKMFYARVPILLELGGEIPLAAFGEGTQ